MAPFREDATEEMWSRFEDDGAQTGLFVISRPSGVDRIIAYAAVRDIEPGLHLSIAYDVTERRRKSRL